jgi:hypothetical protein
MTPTLFLSFTLLLSGDAPTAKDETPRKPNPLAPSLPLLTKEEEANLDAIISRFIQYDTGKLGGDDGKKALEAFQGLGPEATFALIRGLNKAAQIEATCPAATIGKKLKAILKTTKDPELLEFARENIGAGVSKSPHMGILKDLKVAAMLRKKDIGKATLTTPPATVTPPPISPQGKP